MSSVRETIKAEIQPVADEVKSIKKYVSSIDSRVEALEKSQPTIQQNMAQIAATVAHEVRDINCKINNVIMLGVTEITSQGDSKNFSNDKELIVDLLSLIPNFFPKIVNCHRLPKADVSGFRPLAVTFESRSDIFTLLKNVNKLPNNIRVKTDKTRAQRDYLTNLYKTKEKFNLENPGDTLSIKYINDVPHLIDALSKPRSTSNPKHFL